MDSTALLSVVGGAVVLSIIILTGLCLNCKENNQRKYITQTYLPTSQSSQGFTVLRTYTENHSLPTHNSVNQFIISPSSPDPRRMSACPSSECESEYVNQQDDDLDDPANGYELPPEKSQDFPDYLDVLPDDPHQSQPSLASSANSGQNYENVIDETQPDIDKEDAVVVVDEDDDDDDDSDSQQYINVQDNIEINIQTPFGSVGSCSSDGQDYVNAPNQVKIHLG